MSKGTNCNFEYKTGQIMSGLTAILWWKRCTVIFWTTLLNIGLCFVVSFLDRFVHAPFLWDSAILAFAAHAAVIFLYSITLQNIPISYGVISAGELLKRLVWIGANFTFAWLLIFASVPSESIAGLMSIFVCFVYAVTEKFAVYISFTRASRLEKLRQALRLRLGSAIFVGVMAFFAHPASLFAALHVFIVSSFANALTSVVMSESVSFASRYGERLLNGLRQPDGLVRFLAFEDLFEISRGSAKRREFLFNGKNADIIGRVVAVCHGLFEEYRVNQMALIEHGTMNVPVHRTHESQWRRTQIDRPMSPKYYERAGNEDSALKKVLDRVFGRQGRRNRMTEIRREGKALNAAPLVMYATQAMVGLMFKMKDEHKLGVGAKEAQNILNDLLKLRDVLVKTEHYRWTTANFGEGWFVKTPRQLTSKTMETVKWGIGLIEKYHSAQLKFDEYLS